MKAAFIKKISLVAVLTLYLCGASIVSHAAQLLAGTSTPVHAAAVANTIDVQGLDLHDGTVQKFGSTYYLYGTMYGCGFHWGVVNTPWCGFGVSTATSLNGPWSTPTRLFSPTSIDSFTGTTWQTECGGGGNGCFNPRMVQRTWGPNDGVFILYFNAPADWARNHSNAYYAMGCNSAIGQCGDAAGPPYGSTKKPPLYICAANGDFTIVTNGSSNPYIVCTMPGSASLSIEQLDKWGTSGTNVGARNLGGLRSIESPGMYQDSATGKWILTYSDPNCGYCAGTGTGYATATSPTGTWTVSANSGASAPLTGRREISSSSCGGQPRTAFSVDGQNYEWIDLWGTWNGTYTNQTNAGIVFATLSYTPTARPNGGVLPPQFAQWPCS